jgi:hypothetical protein
LYLAENDSNLTVKQRPKLYNKPTRRQALFEIRRLIVEEGLSHSEIQLRLNLKPASYFRYLDLLFKTEQDALEGSNYSWKYLLNESQILYQRYIQGAREFKKIANDPNVDAEQRMAALDKALDYQRAAHDLNYYSPSYLVAQGLILPAPKKNYPGLRMSRQHWDEKFEEEDPSEVERIKLAGEVRQKHIAASNNTDNNNNNNQLTS